MFRGRKLNKDGERLDRIGTEALRSAAMSDEETDRAAFSPFLYTRVLNRIEAERQKDARGGSILNMAAAGRAVSAFALAAIIAVATFWIASSRVKPVAAGPANGPTEATGVVSACSLSSTDECAISNEDVLATLFAEAEGGEER
jgi:hypothetical protein